MNSGIPAGYPGDQGRSQSASSHRPLTPSQTPSPLSGPRRPGPRSAAVHDDVVVGVCVLDPPTEPALAEAALHDHALVGRALLVSPHTGLVRPVGPRGLAVERVLDRRVGEPVVGVELDPRRAAELDLAASEVVPDREGVDLGTGARLALLRLPLVDAQAPVDDDRVPLLHAGDDVAHDGHEALVHVMFLHPVPMCAVPFSTAGTEHRTAQPRPPDLSPPLWPKGPNAHAMWTTTPLAAARAASTVRSGGRCPGSRASRGVGPAPPGPGRRAGRSPRPRSRSAAGCRRARGDVVRRPGPARAPAMRRASRARAHPPTAASAAGTARSSGCRSPAA